MFTKLGPNSVESAEGFRIERTGRMELSYREGHRSLFIVVEPGNGLAIYRASISAWNPPNEGDPITSEERKRIIRNVCGALDFLQVHYVLA